jgi:hypothetical protein
MSGFEREDRPYPTKMSGFRRGTRSAIHPEKYFKMLERLSAAPSTSPTNAVLAPRFWVRKRGRSG